VSPIPLGAFVKDVPYKKDIFNPPPHVPFWRPLSQIGHPTIFKKHLFNVIRIGLLTLKQTWKGVKLWWMAVDGGRGSAPCGCPHRKLEPTDVILSFSYAKKLAFLRMRILSFDGIKSGNCFQ